VNIINGWNKEIDGKTGQVMHVSLFRMRNFLFWTLLLIPHLEIPYVIVFDTVDAIFDTLRVFTGLIILFLYVYKHRFNLMIIALFVFEAMLLVSSLLDGLEARPVIITIASTFCLLLLCDYMLTVDARTGIDVLSFTFFTLVAINTLTIVLHPQGLYTTIIAPIGGSRRNFFLGQQNHQIAYYCTTFCFLALSALIKCKRLINTIMIALSVCCVISLSIAFSATTALALVALVLFALVANIPFLERFINVKTSFILFFGLFFFFVVFRLQAYFTDLIENMLSRSITLTGRTTLWDEFIIRIWQRPVLGFGQMSSGQTAQMFNKIHYVHPHNEILYLLFSGGVVSLMLFTVILILLAIKLDTQKDKFSLAVIIPFLSLVVTSVTEPHFSIHSFTLLFFVVGYRISDIRKAEIERTNVASIKYHLLRKFDIFTRGQFDQLKMISTHKK
jgi:O-antigen ligase